MGTVKLKKVDISIVIDPETIRFHFPQEAKQFDDDTLMVAASDALSDGDLTDLEIEACKLVLEVAEDLDPDEVDAWRTP